MNKASNKRPSGVLGMAGDPDPRKVTKNVGFILNNTDLDTLKIIKLTNQHSLSGYHRPASETPFKSNLKIHKTRQCCTYLTNLSGSAQASAIIYSEFSGSLDVGPNFTEVFYFHTL